MTVLYTESEEAPGFPGLFRMRRGDIKRKLDEMKKIIVLTMALCAILTTSAFAATDSLAAAQEEVAYHQAQKEAAHAMAQAARQLGLPETHSAITTAQEAWHEHNQMQVEAQTQVNKYKAEEAAKPKPTKSKVIGRFKITHYCPGVCCNGGYGNITALGGPCRPWRTIAVDPKVIPLGSVVHIDGYGDFIAEDTGGAIKGNRIDVCVSNHSEANSLGVTYRTVSLK